MATYKSNTYSGRYLQLTITETTDTINNKSTLKWTLTSTGGSATYYSIAPTTVKINGTTVYSKGATAWSDKVFPAKTGSVSGSIDVTHNSDGKKSVAVVFDTAVWYSSASSYGGTLTLTNLDRTAPTVTITTSAITASGVTVKATASTTCDKWDYSTDDGSTWHNYSTTAGTTATKSITGLTPNTTYKIKVRARKKSNQVYGTSSASSIKTLGASVISSISAVTADATTVKITANITVYNTGFTHKLVIKNGSTTILTISSLTLSNGSNNITLTAAQRTTLLAAMASVKSFTGTFELTTYSGSTQIGSTSSKTATVQTTAANSAPTLSGFTYRDTNTTAVGVTGNNQVLIQDISTLQITANAATAKNGATISSYSVVAGNATAASVQTVVNVGTIHNTGTVPVIVTAVDSRGYTSSATINITVVAYSNTDITTAIMRRVNEVEVYSQVEISGNISTVTINGTNKNAFERLRYCYKKTSDEAYSDWIVITDQTTHNSNSFRFAVGEWLNLDADYSFYVQFEAKDKLTTDTVTLTIPQGTPLLSFRRKKVGVNNRNPAVALDVKGEISMNGFNVLGYVRTLKSDDDLNNITTSGIYLQSTSANATTDKNYPKAIAGYLEVVICYSGNWIMQRYTAYNNSGVYVRTKYNNTWYAWKAETLTAI